MDRGTFTLVFFTLVVLLVWIEIRMLFPPVASLTLTLCDGRRMSCSSCFFPYSPVEDGFVLISDEGKLKPHCVAWYDAMRRHLLI